MVHRLALGGIVIIRCRPAVVHRHHARSGVISFSAVKGWNNVGIAASLVGMTLLKVVLNRGGDS